MKPEEQRLEEAAARKKHWRRWGPYLSERQWGTVREDYSPYGEAWDYFSHDQARSRAYRWGEDGIGGISDNHQRLCFSTALWNGKDAILKERLFGLTGSEGNHGEDVKECYFYLDSAPTHSYMKCLYKYPQSAFPYSDLVNENRRRGKRDFEYELLDTGAFAENRYFDVFIEYAKNSPDDILIQISAINRGDREATLHLLPTLWFRNTWSWSKEASAKPSLRLINLGGRLKVIEASHPTLGARWLYSEGAESFLFTENETNNEKLFGAKNASVYAKDGINDFIVEGRRGSVNSDMTGTKASVHYQMKVGAGETKTVRLRLCDSKDLAAPFGFQFDRCFDLRKREADEFYRRVCPFSLDEDSRNIQRQAFAGMLWSKQFYHYIVEDWLEGDSPMPPPPQERKAGRNRDWQHLYNDDILSMPDKWEYPWFAAWDLAFHAIPLAMIDPDFAKNQLILLTREWYMHPNGQIPAYEWAFGDVNPPVHAWAAWRVYNIERKMYGRADRQFLERIFQKLLLNFTWWVNRKDAEDKNVFQGGFLGLDNIGVFDRSAKLPTGGHIEQADGTSWMAMYCLNMLAIAMELGKENRAYEDIASKFYEHFIYIADAMNKIGGEGLWDDDEGFYYDALHLPDGSHQLMKVRSMVGLIPLFAVETLSEEALEKLPGFKKRLEWFIENREDLGRNVACMKTPGAGERRLLAIVDQNKLRRILEKMLDEQRFLSPCGVRSLSKFHKENPYTLRVNGDEYRVDYEPGESSTGLFGGNSNWRGPVWFPVNFLLIESLQKFHYYFGDGFKVECPTGSGVQMNLWEVAGEISRRLISVFHRDLSGNRAVYGEIREFQSNPHWRNLILFHEYFHGDSGAGAGASHQTGWTGLVAKLIQQGAEYGDRIPRATGVSANIGFEASAENNKRKRGRTVAST
ncbi:MAG: MGH1-like glycoside hydrolase domain-containing protein [Deltaproteobacteria bacterium]